MKYRRHIAISVFLVLIGISQAEGGNITLEMPTGMFINPTAEVQPVGTLIFQACWLNQNLKAGTLNGYVAFSSYTFHTKTEVGMSSKYVDPPAGGTRAAPGGFVRQLLLEEKGTLPAVAAGATFIEETVASGDALTRRSVFASASKTITPEGVKMPARIHIGGKWEARRGAKKEDGSVYGGLDVGLTKTIKLVAEIASKTKFDSETAPYAVGIQYTYKERLGMSLAAINAGSAENIGIYFGIGYPFTGY